MPGIFNKNSIFYLLIGIVTMFAINNIKLSDGGFSFMESSVIPVLKNVAREMKIEPVDLGIDKVTLKKIGDPKGDLNFYKYAANIVISNHGGDLKDGQLVLFAGEEGKHVFIKNDDKGFSLAAGESYIVENYEVLFDGNYNGGKLSVEIKLPEKVDYFSGNNKYDVDVFALPAKIEALGIKEIQEDGTIKLDFNAENYSSISNNYEIYEATSLNIDNSESKYAETINTDESKIYGYYRIKNSKDLVENGNWSVVPSLNSDPHFVKFSINPFEDNAAHYIYLKATNPESGNYVVSNIINLLPQKDITRAAFARFFVEYSGVDVAEDRATNYFVDVADDSWYAPYVKTIYGLGLLKSDQFEFHPEGPMTRGEALRVVMDYFDIDLVNTGENGPFKDIGPDNYLFPYTKALFASGKAGVFGENFQPGQTATKNFLKYLIYEYKKNS